MKNLFYFRLEEAENMKKVYTSWIGKEAHTGKGKKQTLTNITITARKQKYSGLEQLYRVEFVFDDCKILSAYEFLFYNSLVKANSAPGQNTPKTESHA